RVAVPGRSARRVEHGRAGDQDGGAGFDDGRGGLGVDAAVDLDRHREATAVDLGAQLADLGDDGVDELLAAEAGVHGHDQDHVQLGQDDVQVVDGRMRVQGDGRLLAQLADVFDGPVQVRRGLQVDGHAVGA